VERFGVKHGHQNKQTDLSREEISDPFNARRGDTKETRKKPASTFEKERR
jgi:hypothetical protein